jgi:site-specific DNA-cytosine methylase
MAEFFGKKRLQAALNKSGYKMNPSAGPLRFHSHCAGIDSPAFGLGMLGIDLRCKLDPSEAAFHMKYHKTSHVINNIKWTAQGFRAPCFTHQGAMCEFPKTCDILASSFVCKPWARANPKCFKSDPCSAEGANADVDTFHFTVQTLARYLPRVFILENVDGVTHRGSKDQDPLTWMLGHLQNIKNAGGKQAYTIETESGIGGRAAGVCQDRPRTIIFGIRGTEETTAAAVAKCFNKFLKAYGDEGPTTKIQGFLDKHGSVFDGGRRLARGVL